MNPKIRFHQQWPWMAPRNEEEPEREHAGDHAAADAHAHEKRAQLQADPAGGDEIFKLILSKSVHWSHRQRAEDQG